MGGGHEFPETLKKYVDEKYPDSEHDITPVLEVIAAEKQIEVKALTLEAVNEYFDGKLDRTYALQVERNTEKDAVLTVTSDGKAKKDLYYVEDAVSALVTVEYVTTTEDEIIPVADPYEAVLNSGDEYVVELPDLTEKGYRPDLEQIFIYTANEENKEAEAKAEAVQNENGNYELRGTADGAVKYVVNYVRIEEEVPVETESETEAETIEIETEDAQLTDLDAEGRVEKGEPTTWKAKYYDYSNKLIYAFESEGIAGETTAIPTGLNSMLQVFAGVLDLIGDEEKGDQMIWDIVGLVKREYPKSAHDITPLLEAVADANKVALNKLTGAQLKAYYEGVFEKTYQFDEATSGSAVIYVAQDGNAEKRLYFAANTAAVPLTIEYFRMTADGKRTLRVADTYEAMLLPGQQYNVKLAEPVSGVQCYLDTENPASVVCYTLDEEGNEVETPVALTAGKDGKYEISGTMDAKAVRYVVSYTVCELEDYQVNYYGYDIYGKNQVLLYSFIGRGPKDISTPLPTDVNGLLKNLSAAIDSSRVAAAGESGAGMIDKLTSYVRTEYGGGNIKPFLEAIAAAEGCGVNDLTRTQLRVYVAELVNKTYALDTFRVSNNETSIVPKEDEIVTKDYYYIESIRHTHNEPGWLCRLEKVLYCENTEEDHEHTDECYHLICENEDADHEHTDECYERAWVCIEDPDYVFFTVEYFITVNDKIIRIANTHRALLSKGEEYYVDLPILTTEDGYDYAPDAENIFRYTRNEEGILVKEQVELTPDEEGKYKVGGVIEQTTRYVVNYIYNEQLAPYQVNYYGFDVKGEGKTLLYSFIGQGPKDKEVTPSVEVNDMMRAVFEACGSPEVKEAEDNGTGMVETLKKAVNDLYAAQMPIQPAGDKLAHDITPLLEMIADAKGAGGVDGLTRVMIMQYLADALSKIYGMDLMRNTPEDASLIVTSDEKAEKNLYYVVGQKYTVIFNAGIAGAKVEGIDPKIEDATEAGETEAPETEAPEVEVAYEITATENSVTSLATVDISEHTKNDIRAKFEDKSDTHTFIGWVTGKGAGVITDYNAVNAAGKYKDLTIYVSKRQKQELEALAKEGKFTAPTGEGGLSLLSKQLEKMPSGGATYYAVWEPHRSDYTVQVWFEDADHENHYTISHTLDITRSAGIGEKVKHNDFDVERADEDKVIAAANGTPDKDGNMVSFPVSFIDDDSPEIVDPEHPETAHHLVVDTYSSYENSYVYSPFYGFDFYQCPDCTDADGNCTKLDAKTGECTCSTCKKMVLDNKDTTGNKCNCTGVTVDNTGNTVLNVFYTREMWKIVYHPTVELTAYKDYPDGNTGIQETIVGRFTHHILADMDAKDETLSKKYTYEGKYGMPVSTGHQVGSTAALGGGYTGTDYSNWLRISTENADNEDGEGKTQSGAYTNRYRQAFLGKTDNESGLYFKTEEHAYNYYQAPKNYHMKSELLGFKGVAEIVPFVFMEYDNQGDVAPDGTTPDKVTMQRYTGVWKGDRFSRESSFKLDDPFTKSSYEYGTHTMHLYPFYGNVDSEYTIRYYGEVLPGETGTIFKDTSTGISYKEIATETVASPNDAFCYDAKIPAGYTARMWRTSLTDFLNASSFTGKKVTNAVSQSAITGRSKPTSIPPNAAMANPSAGNYADYQKEAVFDGESYYAYLPGWEVWQSSKKVGNIVPDSYWITDWIRLSSDQSVTMNDIDKLDELESKAAKTEADIKKIESIKAMQNRLQTSVRIGWLFPSKSENMWRYMNTSPSARNGFLYPRPPREAASCKETVATNVLALTRNKYNIIYNAAIINKDGEVDIQKIHTTGGSTTDAKIPFEQALTGGSNSNNYFDAWFEYDPSTRTYEFKGYKEPEDTTEETEESENPDVPKDPDESEDEEEDEALKPYLDGGFGKWYLDPDGTIEFSAKTMATMPARNIDVYMLQKDFRYNVVFIDEVTGKKNEEVNINGENKELTNIVDHQVVKPNMTPTVIGDPQDESKYFAGWFLDEEGDTPFSFDQEITEDTLVYAVWKDKEPTEYTVKHILVMPDGTRVELPQTKKKVKGYVGNTVDEHALNPSEFTGGYYSEGVYFEPDFYSKTLVLTNDPDENVIEFEYHYTGRAIIIEYREKDNEEHQVSPDVAMGTNLSYITVKYKDLTDYGWNLAEGESTQKSKIIHDGEKIVIRFLYEREPGPKLTVKGNKFLDDELAKGARFTFTLTGADGKEQKVQAVDGKIEFEEIEFTEAGNYILTITEVNEGEDRITYDGSVYKISVTIKEDAKTKLSMEEPVITKNGQPYTEEELEFRNETVPETEAPTPPTEPQTFPDPTLTISAKKLLDGKAPKGKRFSFTLTGEDGSEQTVKANKGKITFKEISFNAEGEYVYTLKEKNEGKKDIKYDKAEYEIRVIVTKEAAGRLVMSDPVVTRNGEAYTGEIKFKNYTKKEKETESETESETQTETESESQTEAPKTGDNTSGTPYLMIQLAALMLLALFGADKKRRRSTGRDV